MSVLNVFQSHQSSIPVSVDIIDYYGSTKIGLYNNKLNDVLVFILLLYAYFKLAIF